MPDDVVHQEFVFGAPTVREQLVHIITLLREEKDRQGRSELARYMAIEITLLEQALAVHCTYVVQGDSA